MADDGVPERCPYCNCPLRDHYSTIGARKHMAACEKKDNEYHYTGRPSGRPSVHRHICRRN